MRRSGVLARLMGLEIEEPIEKVVVQKPQVPNPVERAQLRKEIQEEGEKVEQFNMWIYQWERAERLRRFIAAYAKKSRSWSAEKHPQYRA